ncbi:MAG: hypothetical protein CL927_18080 [Deltaproteobacteria bacterium]|nr:hypothetical protein [Deltaproteobacteria bacterium]HCH66203.1 hypothetical protein [Deltaproteobacteria bacterium]
MVRASHGACTRVWILLIAHVFTADCLADLDGNANVDTLELSLLLAQGGGHDIGVLDDPTNKTCRFGPSGWMTEHLDHGQRMDGDIPVGLATGHDIVQKFCFDDAPARCTSPIESSSGQPLRSIV